MQRPLQRRLLLLRHAKAVEAGAGDDHARDLSARGLADAQKLGTWLGEQGLWPELVYCSTARRTRQTLAGLGATLPTILSDKLYLASAADLLAQLHSVDDAVQRVMLIGHNPGIHALLGQLAGDFADERAAEQVVHSFPTCTLAVISATLPTWRALAPQQGLVEQLRLAA
ncbi:MAG: SixA phosphatase family protein [Rickettsiales bacterium]